jgi:hypothetical protein
MELAELVNEFLNAEPDVLHRSRLSIEFHGGEDQWSIQVDEDTGHGLETVSGVGSELLSALKLS